MWQYRYTKGLVPKMIEGHAVDLTEGDPPNTTNYFTHILAMTSELTWEAWIKVSQGTTSPTPAGFLEYASGYLYIYPGATVNDPVHLGGWVELSGTDATSLSNVQIPLNTWTHVAMTFSLTGDKKVHLFINGVESTYTTQTTGDGTFSSMSSLYLGATGSLSCLSGLIGVLRMTNRARTQAELEASYRFGIPLEVGRGDLLLLGVSYPWNKDAVSGNELTAAGTPVYTREAMKAAG